MPDKRKEDLPSGFFSGLSERCASSAYHRYLWSKSKRSRERWFKVRNWMVRHLQDPACSMEVNGRKILMPLSHALPLYLKIHPHYDSLPLRLAEFLRKRHGQLNCVDVGANIGDTLAAVYGSLPDKFLAVEPNPRYCTFLRANWGEMPNVRIEDCILSDKIEKSKFVVHEQVGTGRFEQADSGIDLSIRTLDDLLENPDPAFRPNLIKIDTDGHDFPIIRGARKTLTSCLPAILFECGVMPPEDYIQQAMGTICLLGQVGYDHIIIYDNLGRLVGRYPATDSLAVRQLLTYQINCRDYYFDILAMQKAEMNLFYRQEAEYVLTHLPPRLREKASEVLCNPELGINTFSSDF